jgi:hypothetical protein
VLVPNEYVVELGPADLERIGQYDAALRKELAAMVEEHATEQGWSFVGRVGVQFELDEAANPGIFHVRSRAVASHDGLSARPVAADRAAVRPRLVLSTGDGERVVPLDARVTTIGRGARPTSGCPTPASAGCTPRCGSSPARSSSPTSAPPTAPGSTAGPCRARRCPTATSSRWAAAAWSSATPSPGREADVGSALVVGVVKLGLLVLLWMFVIAAYRTVRSDLSGAKVVRTPSPVAAATAPAAPRGRAASSAAGAARPASSWSPRAPWPAPPSSSATRP